MVTTHSPIQMVTCMSQLSLASLQLLSWGTSQHRLSPLVVSPLYEVALGLFRFNISTPSRTLGLMCYNRVISCKLKSFNMFSLYLNYFFPFKVFLSTPKSKTKKRENKHYLSSIWMGGSIGSLQLMHVNFTILNKSNNFIYHSVIFVPKLIVYSQT